MIHRNKITAARVNKYRHYFKFLYLEKSNVQNTEGDRMMKGMEY